nr:c-type cytochrome biogenensis protein [Cyanidiococcus yangmingshanensis]
MKWLIKLEVAISLLLMIALVSVIGTIIPQDANEQQYAPWMLLWQLDHVYHSTIYTSLLVLLSISLMGCTLKVQIPSWKLSRVKRKWEKQEAQVQQGESWHAYERNQLAPMAIHISMISMMAGSMLDALGGYIAQELIPVSEISHIQNVISAGKWSHLAQDVNVRVNDFQIVYDSRGLVKQFSSEVEILDNEGKSKWHDWISVNHPGRYKQIWIYQTDWKWQALRLKVNNEMYECAVKQRGEGALCQWQQKWIWFPKLAKELMIYEEGKTIKQGQIGEQIDGIEIKEAMVATGLQIKESPGLNLIWIASGTLLASLIWLLL